MKDNEVKFVFSFVNLGIQCVRRKELDASLMKRKKKNIDPFSSRFCTLVLSYAVCSSTKYVTCLCQRDASYTIMPVNFTFQARHI